MDVTSRRCEHGILAKINGQASVPRDVFPPTPPGPEGSNGNGLLRVQRVSGAWLFLFASATMTTRLYYNDSHLCEFEAVVAEILPPSDGRPSVILNRSAFYPTSGGQTFDTGWLEAETASRSRVVEVAEAEDGRIVHYTEAPPNFTVGDKVRGQIDRDRRYDHMQQHSGQHVLSAAFLELYQMHTVSFHMGDEACTIDLSTPSLTPVQVGAAERRANEVIRENRQVRVQFVTRETAEKMGLRKLPPAARDELRLVEIAEFDLSACGGTHVSATGQVGAIFLRKVDRVKQGTRVEFVCGLRAVSTARRDYAALTEAANTYSSGVWDVPDQVKKSLEEFKSMRRQRDDALELLAERMAAEAVHNSSPSSGSKVVIRAFHDRDIQFAKLFAQKAVRAEEPVVVFVASTQQGASLVFAQTRGEKHDMGALLKQVLSSVGGRGGGTRDLAQGGVPAGVDVEPLLHLALDTIKR